MNDLSRRGLIGLLTSAATAIRSPGEAIAKAALSTAGGIMSKGEPDDFVGGCGLFEFNSPQWWAQRVLRDKAGGFSVFNREIVPEVACFRSASDMSKHRWTNEIVARRQKDREIAELALNLLEHGKVTP